MDPERMMQLMTEQAQALAREVVQQYPSLTRDELALMMILTWRTRPNNADQINLLYVTPHLNGDFLFLVGQLKEIREILVTKADLKLTTL
jgi:hypothetical protein